MGARSGFVARMLVMSGIRDVDAFERAGRSNRSVDILDDCPVTPGNASWLLQENRSDPVLARYVPHARASLLWGSWCGMVSRLAFHHLVGEEPGVLLRALWGARPALLTRLVRELAQLDLHLSLRVWVRRP
jgi:hypothetical protein